MATPTTQPPMPFAGVVCLVVSNLEYGGAQRQVVTLANQFAACGISSHVISLSAYLPLAAGLEGAASRLHVVQKRFRADVSVVWRLAALLRRLQAKVTHGFLLDAELAARLARPLYRRTIVIGSERNTDYQPRRRHLVPLRLTGRWCDAIIANSHAGKRFRQRVFGDSADSLFVVPNGVDTGRFSPGEQRAARARLGLPTQAAVVGMVASFKTQKNHPMFFRMARSVLERCPQAVFPCIGGALHGGLEGSGAYQAEMRALVAELGIADRVLFPGNQDEVVDWYRACDLTVLTSRREGTPNVLLESMACGVPVVATDVADNALIVREGTGFIVPYDDHAAMAGHVARLLGRPEERRELSRAARAWVEAEFSLARLCDRTLAVYQAVRERRRDGAARW